MVRRDRLVTWPVTELAELLLQGSNPDTARAEFRALAQRVLTSTRLDLPRRNDNAVAHQRRVCAIEKPRCHNPMSMIRATGSHRTGTRPRPGWAVTPGGPVCPQPGIGGTGPARLFPTARRVDPSPTSTTPPTNINAAAQRVAWLQTSAGAANHRPRRRTSIRRGARLGGR
jgi:hypothetical protein